MIKVLHIIPVLHHHGSVSSLGLVTTKTIAEVIELTRLVQLARTKVESFKILKRK